MISTLDFRIFGNGRGLKSPSLNDVFYWLVDERADGRKAGRGAIYNWFPGLGAQLTSRQWTMPRPGERRRLAGHDFIVFRAARHGLRVEVSWALARMPDKLDDAHAKLRAIKADLDRCCPYAGSGYKLIGSGSPMVEPISFSAARERRGLQPVAATAEPSPGFTVVVLDAYGAEAFRTLCISGTGVEECPMALLPGPDERAAVVAALREALSVMEQVAALAPDL